MCKEAEKFTFLLLPTFNKRRRLLARRAFCLAVARVIVAQQLRPSSGGGYASDFNFLLISVYECHRFDSTHSRQRTLSLGPEREKRLRLLSVRRPCIKWAVTVVWFRHSIDPFWTWETIVVVVVEVHRSFVSLCGSSRASERRILNDINSLNRRAIKQLLFLRSEFFSCAITCDRSNHAKIIHECSVEVLVRNIFHRICILMFHAFHFMTEATWIERWIPNQMRLTHADGQNTERIPSASGVRSREPPSPPLLASNLKTRVWHQFSEWFSHFTRKRREAKLTALLIKWKQ